MTKRTMLAAAALLLAAGCSAHTGGSLSVNGMNLDRQALSGPNVMSAAIEALTLMNQRNTEYDR